MRGIYGYELARKVLGPISLLEKKLSCGPEFIARNRITMQIKD